VTAADDECAALDELLNKVERIEVAAIGADDIVILHVNVQLPPSELRRLHEQWLIATELPNRVVVLPPNIEVEIKQPDAVAPWNRRGW